MDFLALLPRASLANTPPPGTWSIYPYDPNRGLPIAFAIIISCLGSILLIQTLYKSYWPHFAWISTFASAVWVGGFIVRAVSVWTRANQENLNLYIAQYVMILMGPPLYAASESFLLGRLMAFLPYHAPIHPGRVLSTFIFLSVAVESLTGSGAGTAVGATHNPSTRYTGYSLVIAGLLLQGAVELGFMALTAYIHWRAAAARHASTKIHTLCAILYITSSQMLVRCIVRAAEAFEARSCAPGTFYCGYVDTHEWVLWVFEVANITIVVAILAALPPRRFLPSNYRVFLDPVDKRTLRLGPGFTAAARRPFIQTLLDPFDFVGIVTGRGQRVDPFWERAWPEATREERDRDFDAAEKARIAMQAKLQVDSRDGA